MIVPTVLISFLIEAALDVWCLIKNLYGFIIILHGDEGLTQGQLHVDLNQLNLIHFQR